MRRMTSILKKTLSICLVAAVAFACSNNIEAVKLAEDVIERVDIKITGSTEMYIYNQSAEGSTEINLVDYNYTGENSHHFDFVIQLESGYEMKVNLYDQNHTNLFERVGIPYDLFVTQDLDDKTKYVVMHIESSISAEVAEYTSNVEGNHGTSINAFSILAYDPINMEILCRVDNVELYNPFNIQELVTVNGTFKGFISY